MAIECKHKATISQADLSGMRSLRQEMPDVDCFIVAPVKRRQKVDFATAVPPLELLQEIFSGRSL